MSVSTILAIDIGNSRTKFGLFRPQNATAADDALPKALHTLAVPHASELPWAELAGWLPAAERATTCVVAAGVQPAVLERLLAQWPLDQWPRPEVIREASRLPLEVRVEFPDKVGIDRLLSAVAANVVRPAATSAIVVSSGTATTVDFISSDGAFAGGAILPGLALAARSLNDHTALLPLVSVQDLSRPEIPAVGRSTTAAIQSGLLYGQIGAVRELVAHMSRDVSTAPLLIVTGGGGPLLAEFFAEQARLEPELTLQGLAVAAQSL